MELVGFGRRRQTEDTPSYWGACQCVLGDGVVLGVGVLSGLVTVCASSQGRSEGQGVGPAQTAQRKVRGVQAVHRDRPLTAGTPGTASRCRSRRGVPPAWTVEGRGADDSRTMETVSSSSTVTASSSATPSYSPPVHRMGTRVTLSFLASASSPAFTVTVCASSQVVVSEGQGVGPAQTAQRKVRGVLAGHRHRHLFGGLVGQLHRVGPAVGVPLLHRQVGLAQHDGDRLVVVHRHRQIGGHSLVLAPGTRVGTRVTESFLPRRRPLRPSPSPSAHRPSWSRRKAQGVGPRSDRSASRSVVSWPVTVTVTSSEGSWDSFTV